MYSHNSRIERCNKLGTSYEHIKNMFGIYTHCFLLLFNRRSPSFSNIPSSKAMLLYVVSEGAVVSNLLLNTLRTC